MVVVKWTAVLLRIPSEPGRFGRVLPERGSAAVVDESGLTLVESRTGNGGQCVDLSVSMRSGPIRC